MGSTPFSCLIGGVGALIFATLAKHRVFWFLRGDEIRSGGREVPTAVVGSARKRAHLATMFSLLLAAGNSSAAEQNIDGGFAPDNKHRVVLVQEDESLEQQYELQIRSVDADKPLYSRVAGSYVSFKAAADPFNFKCLWSPDCRFVAVFERVLKRAGETTIYALDYDKAQEVKIPNLMPIIKSHFSAEIRSGFVRPEVWLPDRQLLLSLTGTQMRPDAEYRFILTLQLRTNKTGKPIAKIISFRQDRSVNSQNR